MKCRRRARLRARSQARKYYFPQKKVFTGKTGKRPCNFAMLFRHSIPTSLHTALHFERFRIYALRPLAKLPFEFVLCLSAPEPGLRYEVKNISFLPIFIPNVPADNDPYRVPLRPSPQSSNLLTSRMYVAIDAIQSIGKAAFEPKDFGCLSDAEGREVTEKLKNWLGL